MKLVTILARELGEWPEGAAYIAQDNDGDINAFKTAPRLEHTMLGVVMWHSEDESEMPLGELIHIADDHATTLVTHSMWQAERERLALADATDMELKEASRRAAGQLKGAIESKPRLDRDQLAHEYAIEMIRRGAYDCESTPKMAYKMADAMIERSKQ